MFGPARIPDIAPAARWSTTDDGVTASLRIEPANPVPGQTVRYYIDAASAHPCCTIMLGFGDGEEGGGFGRHPSGTCPGSGQPTARTASEVATHAYATAGTYTLQLTVLAGDVCGGLGLDPSGHPVMPTFHAASIRNACIAVGAVAAGAGCSPFPPGFTGPRP